MSADPRLVAALMGVLGKWTDSESKGCNTNDVLGEGYWSDTVVQDMAEAAALVLQQSFRAQQFADKESR